MCRIDLFGKRAVWVFTIVKRTCLHIGISRFPLWDSMAEGLPVLGWSRGFLPFRSCRSCGVSGNGFVVLENMVPPQEQFSMEAAAIRHFEHLSQVCRIVDSGDVGGYWLCNWDSANARGLNKQCTAGWMEKRCWFWLVNSGWNVDISLRSWFANGFGR